MSTEKRQHEANRWLTQADADLRAAVSQEAATLDRFYIPTRCPNGLPGLTPHEVYTKDQASRASAAATAIIAEIRRLIER